MVGVLSGKEHSDSLSRVHSTVKREKVRCVLCILKSQYGIVSVQGKKNTLVTYGYLFICPPLFYSPLSTQCESTSKRDQDEFVPWRQ